MVVTALRGAVGFLSRLPVGHDQAAWEAFRRQPATIPVVGYFLGALAAVPFLIEWPATTIAIAYVAWLYLLTGITHLDGLADLGDALVVHGDAEDRRAVMTDTVVGVGGTLALVLVVLAVALAGLTLAQISLGGSDHVALGLVVAAEVGAKTATATVACLGDATHEGLGSSLTEHADRRSLVAVLVVAVPAAAVDLSSLAAAGAVLAALVAGLAVLQIARSKLGGVSGDVLGATNELARVAALHAGVILWTHS